MKPSEDDAPDIIDQEEEQKMPEAKVRRPPKRVEPGKPINLKDFKHEDIIAKGLPLDTFFEL